MSELLKDIYSPAFYKQFGNVLAEVLPRFDQRAFEKAIFSDGWEEKALKARMKHTALVLRQYMPERFEAAADYLVQIITALRRRGVQENSFVYMFFPDYVEMYGLDHYDAAVKSIEQVTQFTSCEFAVRPFIIRYGDKMMRQMYRWSEHDSHLVRRLSSEGSRPRLPWAMAIPALKKDPRPTLPILENLKCDSSEFVRRSVANHLNDISKDHPAIVVGLARQWKGMGKETDGIIKHACRTLLKQGHPEVLKLYGLNGADLAVLRFKVVTPVVKEGGFLEFSFTVQNNSKKPQPVRLEYGVYYRKKSGELSRKVFKISEGVLAAGEKKLVKRRHSFKRITTRVYYAGRHGVSVIVNGREGVVKGFELVV